MIGKLLAGAAAGSVACVAYGTFIEANAFRVRRVNVPVLPSGARKLRVLHFSDFHLLPTQKRKLDFISALAGLEPDLVIGTGDNVAHADAMPLLLDALGRLLDVPCAFVFGSNDYIGPKFGNPAAYLLRATTRHGLPENRVMLPSEELRDAFTSGGWTDVSTARTTLQVGDLAIEVRGTDDAHLHRDDYSLVAGAPDPTADLALGVTHAPYLRVLDAMVEDGVQLTFAGHTHGGQVCVPGWGALTTNCDLPVRQAKGLSRHHVGDKRGWLHVSAGLGSSPFAPYRFACPPEVTLLTLTPGPNG